MTMARMFIRLVLGLLVALAVVLPIVLNQSGYKPALQKAQDAVQATHDRAKALESAEGHLADPEVAGTKAEPSAAAQEVQRISREAVAHGSVSKAEAERLRDALSKLSKERLEQADQ